MDDLKTKHEKLLADAEDCDQTASLSGGPATQATFRRIAKKLRDYAADIEVVMKLRSGQGAA